MVKKLLRFKKNNFSKGVCKNDLKMFLPAKVLL